MIKEAAKYYNLKELWNNLSRHPENRVFIAGGSDLTISLKKGSVKTDCLVDISDIKELSLIEDRDDHIFVGAGVKISEFKKNDLVKKYFPAMLEAIRYFASPSIRNTATLGGNLANSSPSADGVLALVASRAVAVLNYYNQRKNSDIKDIFLGPKKNSLKKDELIEGFLIPKWEHRALFFKSMARKIFGISKAGLCICLNQKNGFIKDISIAVSSVAPVVKRCFETESFLKDKKIDLSVIEFAMGIISDEVSPITDHRSTNDYRREIIKVFLKRALNSIR